MGGWFQNALLHGILGQLKSGVKKIIKSSMLNNSIGFIFKKFQILWHLTLEEFPSLMAKF